MMTTATKATIKKPMPMGDIYQRLALLGLKKSWLRTHVLPLWWSDELARTPSARSEIEIYLARTLGLEISSLRDAGAPLAFTAAPRTRFKRHANSCDEKLKLARALGSRLGILAATATEQTPVVATDNRHALSTLSAQSIRAMILETGTQWIGLKELLEFCHSRGVPVVHATLPDGFKRYDGMALCPHGRPVILSFNGRHSPSWQAFIVAHELGHHVLGHIGVNGEIFDDKLQRNDDDEEESAANQFAIELLTGAEHFDYQGCWPDAPALSREVEAFGESFNVHPGVLLLNLCHHQHKMFALAMAALALVEKGEDAFESFAGASSLFDEASWNDDDAEFFVRLATFSEMADRS